MPTSTPVASPPFRRTLGSGLRLIVVPQARATETAIEIQVRVGSGMETAGTNGLSHLIEHLVFKGTESGKPGAIDTAIESLGGEMDARTDRISTRYAVSIPSANWRSALGIAADMLRHPGFRADDLANERVVIRGEMAWADSEPLRAGVSDLATVAFGANDADRWAIMGPPEALEHFTIADIRAFHQRWYRPENMTVAIVGAVRVEDAERAVVEAFPKLSADGTKAAPTPSVPIVAPAFTPPAEVVRAPLRPAGQQSERALSTVLIGFPIPAASDPTRRPAIDVLLGFLAGSDNASGQLATALIDHDKIALSVGADYLAGRANGLIVLSATGEKSETRRLQAGLVAAVQSLRSATPDADAVANARAAAQSATRYDDATPAGLAHRLAAQDVQGLPPAIADAYVAQLGQVTPEDLQGLISTYLNPDKCAIAAIGPAAW